MGLPSTNEREKGAQKMQHFRLHQGFMTMSSFLLARRNVFSRRELASPH